MGEDKKKLSWWCCGCDSKRGNVGWGVFFLVLGSYFLAQELGYISFDVSIWPVMLSAFGLYLIVKGVRR